MEFLGDVVLELVVTAELLARHPDASEGDLAWMRQQIVGRDACASVARDLGLPALFVADAPARRRTAARDMADQVSVQAALVEALIGACWTDLGHERTATAVLEAFGPVIDGATLGRRDAKTALQEAAAQVKREVRYELVAREGPPHARTFTSRVLVGGEEAGRGSGTSKQASEQEAAREALPRVDGEQAG
jgi:ribonuclease-3